MHVSPSDADLQKQDKLFTNVTGQESVRHTDYKRLKINKCSSTTTRDAFKCHCYVADFTRVCLIS